MVVTNAKKHLSQKDRVPTGTIPALNIEHSCSIRFERGKMKLVKGFQPKGETNVYYIVLGVFLTLAVIFALKYHDDHKNDITIHPPHIDVK
jgi:hypothetical protein